MWRGMNAGQDSEAETGNDQYATGRSIVQLGCHIDKYLGMADVHEDC